MKKIYLPLMIFMISLFEAFALERPSPAILKSEKDSWSVKINGQGAITKLDIQFNDKLVNIPWRTDSITRPVWFDIKMTRVKGDKLLFDGKNKDQVYTIEYKDVNGKLIFWQSNLRQMLLSLKELMVAFAL